MISDEVRARLDTERKAQGREMKELSLAAGLGETYVRDVIKRGRGKVENLALVAKELGRPASWLFDDYDGDSTPIRAKLEEPEPSNARGKEPPPQYGSPLDVLGVSRGGEDGRLIFNGERIETIPRPAELEGIEGAYASYVIGDSMKPRFKEGDRVWVHPRRPARKGNDVIVQIFAEDPDDPPEGFIKEYVGYSNNELVLTQHHPEKPIKFKRERVKSVHVIVGALYA